MLGSIPLERGRVVRTCGPRQVCVTSVDATGTSLGVDGAPPVPKPRIWTAYPAPDALPLPTVTHRRTLSRPRCSFPFHAVLPAPGDFPRPRRPSRPGFLFRPDRDLMSTDPSPVRTFSTSLPRDHSSDLTGPLIPSPIYGLLPLPTGLFLRPGPELSGSFLGKLKRDVGGPDARPGGLHRRVVGIKVSPVNGPAAG